MIAADVDTFMTEAGTPNTRKHTLSSNTNSRGEGTRDEGRTEKETNCFLSEESLLTLRLRFSVLHRVGQTAGSVISSSICYIIWIIFITASSSKSHAIRHRPGRFFVPSQRDRRGEEEGISLSSRLQVPLSLSVRDRESAFASRSPLRVWLLTTPVTPDPSRGRRRSQNP